MRISDILLTILSPKNEFPVSREEIPREQRPNPPLPYTGPPLPLDGLFVVAAFETASKNRLQNFGRRLYYRNPERFQFLLPYLNHHQAPGVPKPGRQPVRPAAEQQAERVAWRKWDHGRG